MIGKITMRTITTLIASIFVFSMLASGADARRGGGYGTNENLSFVASTSEFNNGSPLSLCHLTKTVHVMFLNFYRSVEGYGLAENGCDTESFFQLDDEDIRQLRQAGSIPKTVPDLPKLGTADLVKGFWGWLVVIAGVGALVLAQVKRKQRKAQREQLMGQVDPRQRAIIDLICHAAKADGTIDKNEVVAIQNIAKTNLNIVLDFARVEQIATLAEENLSDNGLKALLKNIDVNAYADVMRAVLAVVAADGVLAGKEQQLVGKIATEMRISGEQIRMMLVEIAGQRG